ncbi:MAG: DUF721 domain-containing protein [Flavobacteriales bacterium]|nr:DUF721 domain-containing protein [Flavobacteriales bacterium]
MKRSNEQSLGEVIGGLVDAYGLREKLDQLEVASLWDELAGPMIARHTTSIKLLRGVLRIRVDNAPLRHELTFQREGLVRLVNERMGRAVVKEVMIE